eukprot:6519792-Pyramimonas_sp.AAC.1
MGGCWNENTQIFDVILADYLIGAVEGFEPYTQVGHQSSERRSDIPAVQTNHVRGGRIFPQCEPITREEVGYSRSVNQSREGRSDIPAVRTNQVRGGRIFPQCEPIT